jgi:hypothetical protein
MDIRIQWQAAVKLMRETRELGSRYMKSRIPHSEFAGRKGEREGEVRG